MQYITDFPFSENLVNGFGNIPLFAGVWIIFCTFVTKYGIIVRFDKRISIN